MEVSKMKVLIYTLTFLGYAWSGYGSSLLSTFRDAILSAEHVFGDFLENFGKFIDKVKDISKGLEAAVDDSCVYTCPEGGKPVKNKYHTPSSNGCGPLEFQIPTEGIPVKDLTTCCDQHDICYDTCNSRKETCDKEFAQCLDKICKRLKKALGDKPADVCTKIVKTAFTGVYGLGCNFYLESQKKACYCPKKNGRKFHQGGEL